MPLQEDPKAHAYEYRLARGQSDCCAPLLHQLCKDCTIVHATSIGTWSIENQSLMQQRQYTTIAALQVLVPCMILHINGQSGAGFHFFSQSGSPAQSLVDLQQDKAEVASCLT